MSRPINVTCALDAYKSAFSEIETLRQHLQQLGYDTPRQNYTFEPPEKVQVNGTAESRPVEVSRPDSGAQSALESARPLAPKPSKLAGVNNPSSYKRKHDGIESINQYGEANGTIIEPRATSRDLMPPPLSRTYPKAQEHGGGDTRLERPQAPTSRPPFMGLVRDDKKNPRLPVREHDSRHLAIPHRSETPHGRCDPIAVPEYPVVNRSFGSESPAKSANFLCESQTTSRMNQDRAGVKPFSRRSIDSPTKDTRTLNQPLNAQMGRPSHFGHFHSRSLAMRSDRVPERAIFPQHYRPFDPIQQSFDISRASPETSFPQKPDWSSSLPAQSPFFGHDRTKVRPLTMLRPPTRGDVMSRAHGRYQDHSVRPHHRLDTMRDEGRYQVPTSSLSRRAEQRCWDAGQRTYPTQIQARNNVYQQSSEPSSFPASSSGLLHRSQPPSQHSGKSAFGHRGRITLPPQGQASVHHRAIQDTTLSQIPGVRGLGSHSELTHSRTGGTWELSSSHGSRYGVVR